MCHTRVNPNILGLATFLLNCMSIISFFRSFSATPTFQTGERVNHVKGGAMDRTDGYVVAQTDKGVLVEWPRTGASFVAPSELSLIG